MSTYTNFISSSIKKEKLISSQNSSSVTSTFCRLITTTIIGIIIISTIVFQTGHSVASAEYFSSVDMSQKLGDVEMGLLQTFRHYLQEKEKELKSYERFIENIKLQHSIAVEDVEDYLGNPINAFTLIKRMVTDWNNLHEFITNSVAGEAFRENIEKLKLEQNLPDENELRGAVKGLLRLQKVYELNAEDLADGKIKNLYSSTELSWHDCFEIATNLFDLKEYEFALRWLEKTLKILNQTESTEKDATEHRFEIETLEYMALTYNELGNNEKAIEYIDKILKISPNHHTKDIRTYIMNSPAKQLPKPFSSDYIKILNNYKQLCQGIQIPEKIPRLLKCSVETRGNPHFMLAPLKIEQLNKDPPVNVYHGLLTDVHIDQIIKEAGGKLFRSTVVNGTRSIPSEARVSQQAWLQYKSPVMKYIFRLVGEITGLDLNNSEYMQMANYGIGGQYEPHYDFLGKDVDQKFLGDRIVTNMFYLSDVEQGGFTVFPKINVFSRPIKGSMVFWYNLHKSLDEDRRTIHAGCPVVTGSKRIGNVWIHSGFQEFRRPCGLENDKVEDLGY